MKTRTRIFIVGLVLFLSGCATAYQTTKGLGSGLGQGVRAAGGITEGGAEGYKSGPITQENPYNR
jgi:hypothetical protein